MPEEKSKETVKQLFIQFLESRNLRKTPERFAILEKIYTTTQHFDVETLYEDYESGKNLVEEYGVIVDQDLHNEVLARYENLHIAPYKGFVNPVYTPITDENGNITDIQISYNEGYAEQMLRYSKDYSPLPIYTSIPVVCK